MDNVRCTPRTVLTDGVSMCIRYGMLQTALPCKSKNEENLQDFVQRTNATLMADDPGRVNPFFMTRRSGNGFRHMKLSRRMYKIVGLSTRFQEERTKRKEIAVAAAEASMAETGGWKSRDLQGYKQTMKVFQEHGKLMMDHYTQKDYTKFKMISYRRKQSVIIQRFAHFMDVDKPTKFTLSNRVRHPISKRDCGRRRKRVLRAIWKRRNACTNRRNHQIVVTLLEVSRNGIQDRPSGRIQNN